MSTLKIAAILSASAVMVFAANAHAGEAKEGTVVNITTTANTTVLSSSTQGLIRVMDENGNVFYNQIVPTAELQDVSLDAEVIDTVTFEHEGRIYTNKIVK